MNLLMHYIGLSPITIIYVPYLTYYLDDFLLISPTQATCQQAKQVIITLFTSLGIPLSWNKIEGPSTMLTFLGIQLDTVKWQLRLPDDKLSNLISLLFDWLAKKRCTECQLLSLKPSLHVPLKPLCRAL